MSGELTCETCGLVTLGHERVADTLTDHLTDSDCVEALKRERAALARRVAELEGELGGLRAFKAGVDEALNSGDGSYRP